MGHRTKLQPREIFLGEWLDRFDVGASAAARIAGCDQSYISNIRGGRKPNINALYLLALSEALGVTVNDFYLRPPSEGAIAQLKEYSPQAQSALLTLKRKAG